LVSNFICPVCGGGLNSNGKTLSCENRHSYDLAKSGYVNLLLNQKAKSKRHGDDRLMVNSRRDFLDRGYYLPLLETLIDTVSAYAASGCRILDAGCGECWYTANIYEQLTGKGAEPVMFAVDISKAALTAGAKRNRNIELAVASTFRLPVRDGYCDLVLSLFAPFEPSELKRVLKPGGILIRAIPLERHLLSLKEAVYEKAYENTVDGQEIEGFKLIKRLEIRKNIRLESNTDIINLFTMTPYYYKTSAADQAKLKGLDTLETQLEFGVLVYENLV
jgi:23S rRNA (guanine745-N1)-methyltransferase